MKRRARTDKQEDSATGPRQPAALSADCGDFDARKFARTLEQWFERHGRHDLPWRLTTDPYAILVSELMLQQTQVATVVRGRYLERWLEVFPDLQTLAAASEEQVLKAWQGLGYYRRARTLHNLARTLVGHHAATLPRNVTDLQALPGIGPYTAGAVASLAFGCKSAVVDGNVARIVARLFDFRDSIDSTAGKAWSWQVAQALVDACQDPRRFNSALMELGQMVCVPGQPRCGTCPVRAFCRSGSGQGIDPAELPRKKPLARPTEVEEAVLWWRRGDRLLLQQIPAEHRRAGLWRLPEIKGDGRDRSPLHRITYGITRYRVRLTVFAPAGDEQPPAGEGLRWVDVVEREPLAIAAPYLKAIAHLERQPATGPPLPGL